MPKKLSASIQDHFVELTDPQQRKVIYPLINIVTIAICAVICGADDFVSTHFGRKKRKWLSQFPNLSNGIPSHDRFNAVLAAIKPAEFEACLLSWISDLHEITAGQIVAIDGKTLRRSFDTATSKSAIHMASAWVTANHMSLGQTVVDAKSNEITAIPKLIKMLELAGSFVTIDAMGCQTAIARMILDAKADYVLAVKENQRMLYEEIDGFFLEQSSSTATRATPHRHQTRERGHGREKTRSYFVSGVPRVFSAGRHWPILAAIGMVINETQRDGKWTFETRYYILSKKLTSRQFAKAVRSHWSIENNLHWQLDVTFQEDQCRLRRGNADANFSIFHLTALSLLKNNHALKIGVIDSEVVNGPHFAANAAVPAGFAIFFTAERFIGNLGLNKNKRLAAGWDDD